MKDFDGGYYLINQPLMRSGVNAHTDAHPGAMSDTMIQALNAIQEVPWRINGWILDVQLQAWEHPDGLGVVPRADPVEIPDPVDPETWATMDAKERGVWKFERAAIYDLNARLVSQRYAFVRQMHIALEMRHEPQIFFPHFMDFRGRFYPMVQDLQPQSNDIARALLEFAEGKKLGSRGVYWLAVRLANTYGLDKLSFDERVDWVDEHNDLIARCGADPFAEQWWTGAEHPWMFLATCREWSQLGLVPLEYVSHLPVSLDGSVNGIQHLSLMGRDPVGAKASNCSARTERFDLYQEVADAVQKLVVADVTAGIAEASNWLAKGIRRETCKRAVMTSSYGVTDRGIRDQLIKDGHTNNIGGPIAKHADYLALKIRSAMSTVSVSAIEIMTYFQKVSSALAEAGYPLRWVTPAGMTVWQAYHHHRESRVTTLLGCFVLWDEDAELGLSRKKQVLAAAPNVVHSFDAAMLALTALKLKADGLSSFVFIHDSYGTHAADADQLSATLRSVAVEIYSVDRLREFAAYIKVYAPDVTLPDPPELGTFDVTEVLKARYFFA